MPDHKRVSSGGDVVQHEIPIDLRDAKIGVIKNQNHGIHVGMDVTKDFYDTRAIKFY